MANTMIKCPFRKQISKNIHEDREVTTESFLYCYEEKCAKFKNGECTLDIMATPEITVKED